MDFLIRSLPVDFDQITIGIQVLNHSKAHIGAFLRHDSLRPFPLVTFAPVQVFVSTDYKVSIGICFKVRECFKSYRDVRSNDATGHRGIGRGLRRALGLNTSDERTCQRNSDKNVFHR